MPFFEGFVNPGLLIGASLAAVPLIIHLLNRRRHKPLAWAAMRFVLAAYRRTRRRARLENLLLLFLRMAAIALLALAIARPFSGAASPLAQLAEARRDVVLVLDASASTGYRGEVQSVFERAVARAKQIVLELDGAHDDRVRLLVAGARPRLVASRRPDEALSVLATLAQPYDEALDLAAALGEVARFAAEDTPRAEHSRLEIRLLTDLQKRNFVDSAGAPASVEGAPRAPALDEQLDALRKLGALVLLEDLGPSETLPANLGIESLELASPLLGAGAGVDVSVSVRNFGASARNGLRVSLTVDADGKLPYRPLDVPARGSARATFPVTFATSGAHVLTARIEADRLAVDDVRSTVVLVPAPVRVLLVDGEPARELEQDEVGYLHAVLDPPRGDEVLAGADSAPFQARVIEAHELRDAALEWSDWDVIVLANVESLPGDVVEKLERWTAAGGASIVTLGKQVEAASFNARLFRADGSGLAPLELASRTSIARRDGSYRVGSFDATHPALAFFADERWRPLLAEAPVYEFFTSRPLEGARVLARLSDEAASPLLVEKSYDRGKVFVWTTSIDAEWTRLPEWPWALVPLVHEWLRYAARPLAPPRNLAVGASLTAEVSSFPRSPQLVLPDGARRPLDGEPLELAPGLWRLTALGAAERAGVYQLELEGEPAQPFAAALAPLEGDLERLAANELAALHPVFVLVGAEGASRADDTGAPHREGELWRGIALACFVALVLETLWAAWLGRTRRSAP